MFHKLSEDRISYEKKRINAIKLIGNKTLNLYQKQPGLIVNNPVEDLL